MKKKIKEEIRAKSPAELVKEIEKRETELLRLKMEMASGKIKNTSLIRHKKDELAIVKTILQEKRLQDENVHR